MTILGIISLVLFVAQVAIYTVAALMYKPPRGQKQDPTFVEFRLSATKIGMGIPATFGQVRLGGNLVEWGDWQVWRQSEHAPGGGGGGKGLS